MYNLPEWVTGLRLCKITKSGDLKLGQIVQFLRGRDGVDTVLRRASISGEVGPIGETGDFWADLMNKNNEWEDTIRLDKDSWNSLKNHWMRCKMEAR